jgi:hypothetical protein
MNGIGRHFGLFSIMCGTRKARREDKRLAHPATAWGISSGFLGLFGAFLDQYLLATIRFDGDPIGVHLGISDERFLDLVLKL